MTIPADLLRQKPLTFDAIAKAIGKAQSVDIYWHHVFRESHMILPYFTVFDGNDMMTLEDGKRVTILIRSNFTKDPGTVFGGSFKNVECYEARLPNTRGATALLKVLLHLSNTLPLQHEVGRICTYRKG